MKGKQGGKKAYVKKAKGMRSRAKKETDEDINQNFEINKLKKEVSTLTKGTKGYGANYADSVVIPTVIGSLNSTNLNTFNIFHPSNIGGMNTNGREPSGPFITMNHVGLNYQIDMESDSSTVDIGTSMLVRVMLVCVHQPPGDPTLQAGSVPSSFSDIFLTKTNAADPLISADLLDHYVRLGRQNFEVLYDKTHTLVPMIGDIADAGIPSQAGAQPFTGVHHVNVSPQKRSRQIQYNQVNDTSFISVAQNQYYFLCFSDNPTAGNTSAPTLTYNMVVDYVE